jgi:hypothetical protein
MTGVPLTEGDVLQMVFDRMLRKVTGDGAKKRRAGAKKPWWKDGSHEAAIFSHLNRWKHGELQDPDSGAHPLVHAAWRCLAIAYQESYGQADPTPAASASDELLKRFENYEPQPEHHYTINVPEGGTRTSSVFSRSQPSGGETAPRTKDIC